VPSTDLAVSVLSLGEVRRGIERLRGRDPRQATSLEGWLHRVSVAFADRILPVTADIADSWGRLGVPDPVPAVDALIAATALVHELTVVTRNERDFLRCGVSVVNPWSDAG
jgi:predicted nucleic acid-binding protein